MQCGLHYLREQNKWVVPGLAVGLHAFMGMQHVPI
jgi:hypothetical protein